LNINKEGASGVDSRWVSTFWGKKESDSKDYTGGSMKVTVTNSQGKSEMKSYGIKLSKKNKEDYQNHQT